MMATFSNLDDMFSDNCEESYSCRDCCKSIKIPDECLLIRSYESDDYKTCPSSLSDESDSIYKSSDEKLFTNNDDYDITSLIRFVTATKITIKIMH